MTPTIRQAYNFKELLPLVVIFGIAALLMGIVGVVIFGPGNARFAWILVAGGIVTLALTPLLDDIVAFLAGPVPDMSNAPKAHRTQGHEEPSTRRAS